MGKKSKYTSNFAEMNPLQRYKLSFYSYRQLQRDFIRFKNDYALNFTNGFICGIIINYLKYHADNKKQEFISNFQNYLKTSSSRRTKGYKPDSLNENSFRLTVTKDLNEIIHTLKLEQHDNYTPQLLFNYVLESYSKMYFSDREMICCYDIYKTITEGIRCCKCFRVTAMEKGSSQEQTFEFKPYRLELDDNAFSYYLIGFSRPYGDEGEFKCDCIKLSRIIKCSTIEGYSLTGKEEEEISERLGKYGAAYIKTENNSLIEILLTEAGYKQTFLKRIVRQRPIPVEKPECITIGTETYYKLKFDCSQDQIRYYFFTFGNSAEILSPPELRERFISDYKNALESYSQGHNPDSTI